MVFLTMVFSDVSGHIDEKPVGVPLGVTMGEHMDFLNPVQLFESRKERFSTPSGSMTDFILAPKSSTQGKRH